MELDRGHVIPRLAIDGELLNGGEQVAGGRKVPGCPPRQIPGPPRLRASLRPSVKKSTESPRSSCTVSLP